MPTRDRAVGCDTKHTSTYDTHAGRRAVTANLSTSRAERKTREVLLVDDAAFGDGQNDGLMMKSPHTADFAPGIVEKMANLALFPPYFPH